ncbi:MAG: hypothetical protein ACOYMB_04665 [Patescibacteria group bacterium]
METAENMKVIMESRKIRFIFNMIRQDLRTEKVKVNFFHFEDATFDEAFMDEIGEAKIDSAMNLFGAKLENEKINCALFIDEEGIGTMLFSFTTGLVFRKVLDIALEKVRDSFVMAASFFGSFKDSWDDAEIKTNLEVYL